MMRLLTLTLRRRGRRDRLRPPAVAQSSEPACTGAQLKGRSTSSPAAPGPGTSARATGCGTSRAAVHLDRPAARPAAREDAQARCRPTSARRRPGTRRAGSSSRFAPGAVAVSDRALLAGCPRRRRDDDGAGVASRQRTGSASRRRAGGTTMGRARAADARLRARGSCASPPTGRDSYSYRRLRLRDEPLPRRGGRRGPAAACARPAAASGGSPTRAPSPRRAASM